MKITGTITLNLDIENTKSAFDDVFTLTDIIENASENQMQYSTKPPEKPAKNPTRLDPIQDIIDGKQIEIEYKARFMNSTVPYMDFSKGDRRYVELLIAELNRPQVYMDDMNIMAETATARRAAGKKQSWSEFIDELHSDKVVNSKDFSAAQLVHIPKLISKLTETGKRLKNGGSINFKNKSTGEIL